MGGGRREGALGANFLLPFLMTELEKETMMMIGVEVIVIVAECQSFLCSPFLRLNQDLA